jgi:LPXTG-motif cell wall-anchored protein
MNYGGGGGGTLPITGTNVTFVVAGGLLLVGVGVVLFCRIPSPPSGEIRRLADCPAGAGTIS